MAKKLYHIFTAEVFITIAATALTIFLIYISNILLLIFGAVLTAIILRTIAEPIEKKSPLNHRWSLAAAILIVVIISVSISFLLGHIVSSQMQELSQQTSVSWDSLKVKIKDYYFGDVLISEINNFSGKGFLAKIPLAAFSVIGALANFLVVLVCGIFIALNPAVYRNGLLKLFPKNIRDNADEAFTHSENALKLWFKGKLISMASIGVLMAIMLAILGIPSSLAIGVIAGIGEFIPYVGAFASAAPALLLALLQGPEMVLWVFLGLIAVQQFQGNVIMPLVQERMVSLPPALLIFSLLTFGYIFGLTGLLLAEPLTVFLFVMVKKLYVRDTLGEEVKIPGEKKRK